MEGLRPLGTNLSRAWWSWDAKWVALRGRAGFLAFTDFPREYYIRV